MGLTGWKALIDVILPQAARIATPPTVSFLVQLIKNTSLASVMGLLEADAVGAGHQQFALSDLPRLWDRRLLILRGLLPALGPEPLIKRKLDGSRR